MKEDALKILSKIEENVEICCAITMEPDTVIELIEQLRKIIKELQ